jgi:hypothetical protein
MRLFSLYVIEQGVAKGQEAVKQEKMINVSQTYLFRSLQARAGYS